MNFDELLSFIDTEDKRIRDLYNNIHDEDKRILFRTVKLVEEVGELAEAVNAHLSYQRKEKLEKKDIKLAEEVADVIITTLLIAKSAKIDVIEALSKKIVKIKSRNY